jgi:hypothetical protein
VITVVTASAWPINPVASPSGMNVGGHRLSNDAQVSFFGVGAAPYSGSAVVYFT